MAVGWTMQEADTMATEQTSRDGPSISSSYRDGAYKCPRRSWGGLERVWRTAQGTDDESKE